VRHKKSAEPFCIDACFIFSIRIDQDTFISTARVPFGKHSGVEERKRNSLGSCGAWLRGFECVFNARSISFISFLQFLEDRSRELRNLKELDLRPSLCPLFNFFCSILYSVHSCLPLHCFNCILPHPRLLLSTIPPSAFFLSRTIYMPI
jgi:hypothetical protein